jgi:hypothetical protein
MGPTPQPPPPDGMVPAVAMWTVTALFLAGVAIAIGLAIWEAWHGWRRRRRARPAANAALFVGPRAEHWRTRCN